MCLLFSINRRWKMFTRKSVSRKCWLSKVVFNRRIVSKCDSRFCQWTFFRDAIQFCFWIIFDYSSRFIIYYWYIFKGCTKTMVKLSNSQNSPSNREMNTVLVIAKSYNKTPDIEWKTKNLINVHYRTCSEHETRVIIWRITLMQCRNNSRCMKNN